MIDWPLMRARYWGSTDEDPDRSERRQAECLVHDRVPWSLITDVAAKSEAVAAEVRAVLAAVSDSGTQVHVRPGMYF